MSVGANSSNTALFSPGTPASGSSARTINAPSALSVLIEY